MHGVYGLLARVRVRISKCACVRVCERACMCESVCRAYLALVSMETLSKLVLIWGVIDLTLPEEELALPVAE